MENRTIDEIKVGDQAELRRLVTQDDLLVFANISGNHNPMHLHAYDGDGDGVQEAVAPSMFLASLISAVLGNHLPGAGTLYEHQTLEFGARVHAGEEMCVRVTVTEVQPETRKVHLNTEITRMRDGAQVLSGQARVTAPARKRIFEELEVPGLIVQRHRHFEALLERAEPLPPIPTAIVCPEEPKSLGGALLGAEHTLITPVLIGDPDKIRATAQELGKSIDAYELIEERDHVEAARRAVALVNEGGADALMKGHLHTDELLRPALDKATGLRGRRRFSHVFLMDVPGLAHPLLVTDAAINIAPDLRTKTDIVQNAIDLAISLGIEEPKVGVLSAVETVNPDIPSSVDAALLSKMAERGQIKGGMVEGPLAMDNAVDIGAARTKGLTSPVAGRAEILVVPGLDAGNMLAKQLAFISHAEAAGLVLGARVPIILNSRSDDDMARLASCAVAALHHHAGLRA